MRDKVVSLTNNMEIMALEVKALPEIVVVGVRLSK